MTRFVVSARRAVCTLLAVSTLASCAPPSPACESELRPSVVVIVVAPDGARLADAVASFTSPSDSGECTTTGPGRLECGLDLAGDINLRIEAPGFVALSQLVSVERHHCGVQTRSVQVRLDPDCPELPAPSALVTARGVSGADIATADVSWSWSDAPDESQSCKLDDAWFVCGDGDAGTLTVTASAPGYAAATDRIDVGEDYCGTRTERVDLVLRAADE